MPDRDIAGDPSRGTQILFRLDVERTALDAYSEVFEPSRKQVRHHQQAVKAAAAAVLRALAEKHQEWTAAERCCDPAPEPQCLRCGPGDEVADWLLIEANRLFPSSPVEGKTTASPDSTPED